MVVLQGRTREQIRLSVGYNLNAVYPSSASSNGTTLTLVDSSLPGGDDEHIGKWILFTSGTNDGLIRKVSDSTGSSGTLTFAPAVTATVSGDTYELWEQEFPPARVHDIINQAIIAATGRIFDPEESVALCGDGRQTRFDIPTEFAMINRLEYRISVTAKTIHLCDVAWDESVDSDVTLSLDTKDYRQGSSSNKLVVAAGAAANDILATDAISSLNLSGYTHVELWIKSTVAAVAGDLKLLLDDTALCASALESLSIPALVANTGTYARLALANPRLDTAIISVGLQYVTDLGACTLWIDKIRAYAADTAIWQRLDPRSWWIDKEARDIILSPSARDVVGGNLLKITGGDKPALLSADSDVCEVPEDYVIAYATAGMLESGGGGPSTDPDNKAPRGAYWRGLAEAARRAWGLLQDIRLVD